jgi:hypothetical protein
MSDYDDDEQDSYDPDNENDNYVPAVRPQPKLPALIESLGLGSVSIKDKITVVYENGGIKASVKRANGVTETVHRILGAGFNSTTQYYPDTSKSKDHRNEAIRTLRRGGATQAALAHQFGLSQSMIQRIVTEE